MLKIHRGEGPKVLRFALLAATLQAGLAIGISCADSLFLTVVGADKLPLVYMITPAVMLIYVPLFAYLMGRFGIDRLFDITLGILVAGGIFLYIALSSGLGLYGPSGPPIVVYYIAKLYTALWYISLYTLLWNFVDCYFHILDAKRLFSFLSGGMALGAMAGGIIVTTLVNHIGVQKLFLVWSALALAVFPVLISLRKNCKKITEEEAEADKEKVSFREQTSRIIRVLRTSRYANFMILTFLCTLVITTLCEFQYMQIFETGRSESEIAMLFGKLYFTMNAFNLIVNIFLFNRLTALIGVRNTALIQPVVYAITFSYLLLNSSFGAAVAAFFAYQGILTSIEYNNQNFLFNALPSGEKAQVRTFVEGLCEPLSAAAAGLFLLIYAQRISPQFISVIGLAGAGLALCSVLGLRAHYLTAMVENLKKAWLSFSLTAPRSLSTLDPANINVLREITKSNDTTRALAAIEIYWLNDPFTAVDQLLNYLTNTRGENQRAAKDLFSKMLKMEDSTIFRRVLEWLDKEKENLDAALLEICGRYNLLSPEDVRALSKLEALDKRTAAAVARWQSWHLKDALEMLKVAHRFVAGTEDERVAALHIIGASNQPRYVHFIAGHLKDPSPAVRHEALSAIANLADNSSGRVVTAVLKAIQDADRDTRLAGFEALRAIGDPSCVRPLIDMSPSYPPCDRRHVEDVIIDIGLPCVPILAAMLRDETYPHMRKAIAARALGMLSFPQFQALAPDLIRSGIKSAYRYMVAHWTLSNGEVNKETTRFLSDINHNIADSVVDFVLELLTIAGKLPDFEMLASSLRSTDIKERANAIETIEQGCTRDVFSLLLPLVNSSSIESKIAFYRRTFHHKLPEAQQVITANITSPIAIESAIAIQTAWKLSLDDDAPLDREAIRTMMTEQLLKHSSNILEDVIFSLLTEDTDSRNKLNSANIAASLSEADFFRSMSILEMEHIITGTTIVEAGSETIYRKGDPCDSVYVIQEGSAVIKGNTEKVAGQTCLLGSEAIAGKTEYEADLSTESAVLLKVPVANIIKTAEIYPQVAISLFAEKLGVNRKECSPA